MPPPLQVIAGQFRYFKSVVKLALNSLKRNKCSRITSINVNRIQKVNIDVKPALSVQFLTGFWTLCQKCDLCASEVEKKLYI